jgi:hypothetical protein
MRLTLLGSVIGAGATIVSLAACAGGNSNLAPGSNQAMLPQTARSQSVVANRPMSLVDAYGPHGLVLFSNRAALRFVDPAAVKAQVDAGQYGDPGEVNAYITSNKKNKKPFCTLSNLIGVNAIETDAKGNLWVPQVIGSSSGAAEIIEYAPSCGKAGTILQDPDGEGVDIAFGPNGIDYVSTIESSTGGPGSIAVYPAGQTSPTATLSNSNVAISLGVAVDSKGNVYESYIKSESPFAGGVVEYKGGKGKGTVLKGVKIAEPGTLIIDKNNNMIVTDQIANTLDTYAPPYTKAPATFPLQGTAIQCAIDAAEDNIACADTQNDAIDVYAYPAGTYLYSFDNGLSPSTTTIGVAQDPN